MGGLQQARITRAYSALAGTWNTGSEKWNGPVGKNLVKAAGIRTGMHVLDLGCGTGAATIPAALAAGSSGCVVGIDTARAMLRRARKAAADLDLSNVTFLHGDAAAPQFPPASFDAILASLVVYLLRDPAAAAGRWHALLRPGGVVSFSWVVAEDPRFEAAYDAVDAYVLEGKPTWGATWRRWPSIEAAEAMLPAGFENIRTTTVPVETHYTGLAHWWQSQWLQGPRLCWDAIPLDLRDAAREAAFEALVPLLGDDGTLTRIRTTCYTTASAVALAA
jgi:O-methyltransferase/aklanonic acid methyltransferase